jgi:hypothetical protein
MKKNYIISIAAHQSVLVIDAESEKQAFDYARDVCSFGDLEMHEMRVEETVAKADLEQARKFYRIVAENE